MMVTYLYMIGHSLGALVKLSCIGRFQGPLPGRYPKFCVNRPMLGITDQIHEVLLLDEGYHDLCGK